MPNGELAMEYPEDAQDDEDAYAAGLAEARAESERQETENRRRMLRQKGRLPEQQHVSWIEFGIIAVPAILNDLLDLIEIPSTLSLVFAIPVKVILIALDIGTALIVMLWGMVRGAGFFATRRIVALIVTVLAEFMPGIGIVPGWTLYIGFEWFMQTARERTVKMLARLSPERAEKAAMRLEATQRVAESSAAKLGKTAGGGPALRGAAGPQREAALEARRRTAQKLAPQVREQVLRPIGREYERVSGSSDALRRGGEQIARGDIVGARRTTASMSGESPQHLRERGIDESETYKLQQREHLRQIEKKEDTLPRDRDIEAATRKLEERREARRETDTERNMDELV